MMLREGTQTFAKMEEAAGSAMQWLGTQKGGIPSTLLSWHWSCCVEVLSAELMQYWPSQSRNSDLRK